MQWWCVAQGTAWEWSWQPYPGVWAFILLLAGGYAWLIRGPGAGGEGAGDGSEGSGAVGGSAEAGAVGEVGPRESRRARAWSFGSGLLLLWVALDWPVGALGAGYLASVHMVQFLLIAVAAPPLLLWGVPPEGYRRLLRTPALKVLLRTLTHPVITLGAFTVAMAWTHWPPVVDTLMVSQIGSFALDMIWLASGLLFWWPVTVPLPERWWFRHPAKMGYLISATILNTGVFAYLTYSSLPLYAVYELAPPVGGISTREDQVLAGLLMKMGGAVILWTAISILFYRWWRESGDHGASAEPRAPSRAGTSSLGG